MWTNNVIWAISSAEHKIIENTIHLLLSLGFDWSNTMIAKNAISNLGILVQTTYSIYNKRGSQLIGEVVVVWKYQKYLSTLARKELLAPVATIEEQHDFQYSKTFLMKIMLWTTVPVILTQTHLFTTLFLPAKSSDFQKLKCHVTTWLTNN